LSRNKFLGALALGLVGFTGALLPSLAAGGPRVTGESAPLPVPKVKKTCGSRAIFGRSFSISVVGKPLGCAMAKRISSSACRLRLHRKWSCFSFRESKPFLVWFLTRELFRKRLSTAIVFNRYPCADARVTPALFDLPLEGFPTRRQMLADDLIRCQMLAGGDMAGVEALTGPPDERSFEAGRTSFVYALGPERDSIVQIDEELLLVEFTGETVSSVSIYQGS